jgi:L-Ala-D/L-Glu epimerase
MVEVAVAVSRWPIRGHFTIARGSRTEAVVVEVTLRSDGAVGRGECVPYPRNGESVDSVLAQIEAMRPALEAGISTAELQSFMPKGAARNAVDCALWDLAAKQAGQPVWQLAGLPAPEPVTTAFTLSLDTPDAMEAAARAAAARPLLKIKLGGAGDLDRLAAVRRGAPGSRLIVDANEGWPLDAIPALAEACAAMGVALIEQPLPAAEDAALEGLQLPVPLCADESMHSAADVARLAGRYQCVNIKLDKTGGLTEAIAARQAALAAGLDIMIGCMVGTSLAMAPATILTPHARYVDLDGPLLLAADREPGLTYQGSTLMPAPPALWG